MRTFVTLLGTLALLTGCSGKKEGDKPADASPPKLLDRGEGPPRQGGAEEAIRKAAPEFTLTAAQLAQEAKKDGGAAQAKYRGKVIELTGVVDGVHRNISEEAFISLKGEQEVSDNIMCFTIDQQPWAKITPGHPIKVKGRGSPLEPGGLVALVGAVVLEYSGPALPQFTAQQLADAYQANPDEFLKKHAGRHLLLTGEIDRVERVKFDPVDPEAVVFKTTGKKRVVAIPDLTYPKMLKLKSGQQIRVRCYFAEFRPREGPLLLAYCLPVLPP